MPDATVVPALMVKVVVALVALAGVTEDGFTLHVTPSLGEEQVSATVPLNPSIDETLTVEVAEPPGAIVAGEGMSAEI